MTEIVIEKDEGNHKITKREAAIEVFKYVNALKNLSIISLVGAFLIYGLSIYGGELLGVGGLLGASGYFLIVSIKKMRYLTDKYNLQKKQGGFQNIR